MTNTAITTVARRDCADASQPAAGSSVLSGTRVAGGARSLLSTMGSVSGTGLLFRCHFGLLSFRRQLFQDLAGSVLLAPFLVGACGPPHDFGFVLGARGTQANFHRTSV